MAGMLEKARARLEAVLGGQQAQPKLEDVRDQGEEDQKLAAMVRGRVDEVRTSGARIANEGIWFTNIAYLIGFDSLHYDTATRRFRPLGNSHYLSKDRIHVNKILPTCQNRLARLLKNPPRFEVRPNSTEQEDKDAATLGQRIIQHYWDQEQINDKRIDLKMWCQQAGHAFLKVNWDAAKGNFLVRKGPDGREVLEFEGDIRVDICSPFEIFPDPAAKRFDECRYLTQAKIRPLDYFHDQYPERGHLVKEEGCWLNSLTQAEGINSFNAETGATAGSDKQMKNSAIELSYYEAPSRKHPRGRHVVVANGVVLKNGDLPASDVSNEPAMIPFAKFDDVRIGGKFNSEAIITHMRPAQDQLNRTLNQRARWVNRLLAGKYVAPRGANVASDALNDQSGELVEYTPVPNAANGGEPHALQTPNIPQSAYIEEERLTGHLNDVAGINEASRGQLPSSSIPAIGMQLLVEQDDTRVGVMTEADEYAYARVGKLLLKFTQAYVRTPRTLKFADKNQEYVVKKFKGEDIRGNDDVTVVRGSTLPGSKVLKRQEIINMYTQGLLGDPNDPRVREKVLAQLEYGDVAEAWLDLALDMHQINKGLRLIEQGEKPIVDEQDNHPLWVQELNRYRKSDKFAKLSEEAQTVLLEVREEHLRQEIALRHPDLDDDAEIPPESETALNQAEQVLAADGAASPAEETADMESQLAESMVPGGAEGMG